jgi:glycosyltransferase involved in cell wall biosynthesis
MIPSKNIDFSIIIPVLDERENLGPLYYQIVNVLRKMKAKFEVIFIDDGSTDGSFEVLEELSKKHKEIIVIKFKRNFGKAAALSAGFRVAKGRLIITMDADLQDDPSEIPKFLEKLNEGFDIVSGWKKKRRDPLSKIILSKIFNLVTSWITKINLHDFNCGFKIYKREVVEHLKIYGELHRYIPVLADWKGYKNGEIVVRHHMRVYGKSKYGFSRIIKGFNDFITVLFLRKYVKSPLHFFGFFGIIFIILSSILNFITAYVVVFYKFVPELFDIFILGVLLLVMGIQIFSTGLVAEMIASIEATKEQYVIESIVSRKNVSKNTLRRLEG